MGASFPNSNSAIVTVAMHRQGTGASTWALWAYRANNTADQYIIHVATSSSAFYFKSSDTTMRFVAGWSTTDGEWSIPAPSTGAWHMFMIVYVGTSTSAVPAIWLDGVAQTVTTVTTPVGTGESTQLVTTARIGNNVAGTNNWSGWLAEMSSWTGSISANGRMEMAAARFSALLYDPQEPTFIFRHYPLYHALDIMGQGAVTLGNGAVIVAEHPPVLQPVPQHFQLDDNAAGPGQPMWTRRGGLWAPRTGVRLTG